MVVKVRSMGIFGMDSFEVQVETDMSKGLYSFDVVGMPDLSVRESRDLQRLSA